MARANPDLIQAFKNTVTHLKSSTHYQWGHMGSCNCGFLAQEISRLSGKAIHERAMQKHGDWSEQLNDYCPTSGLLMDDLISQMLDFGLDTTDLRHLEKLSDPRILRTIEKRNLQHNNKGDVILYLEAWVQRLQNEWIENIALPDFEVRQGQAVL